ncbi:MAG: hypothetical protein JWO42_621 [Chloroflexi bacterium]|nr:hypothetical protein [Chloroflexota bacterium]
MLIGRWKTFRRHRTNTSFRESLCNSFVQQRRLFNRNSAKVVSYSEEKFVNPLNRSPK